MSALIGKKIGMTRIFDQDGNVVAVTVLQAGPCVITQVKTREKDGYNAVQLSYGEKKNINKPLLGHLKKAGIDTAKALIEFRDVTLPEMEVGKVVKVDVFRAGEKVKITGTSKGRGFQGVVKRHGFGGGPVTHGQSDRLRAPGSLGQSSFPSRVFKGMRMAGKMGNAQVTVRNLTVVKVDPERNLIFVKGGVPGARNSIVEIRKA